MRIPDTNGTLRWIFIDLDAACKLGTQAGVNFTSSALFTPEMAQYHLDKDKARPVIARVQLDMWYYGLLLLQVCTMDAPTLFQATQAENMLHDADMRELAYHWDQIKLNSLHSSQKKTGTAWLPAMDLVLWCLQSDATDGPQACYKCFPTGSLTVSMESCASWPLTSSHVMHS